MSLLKDPRNTPAPPFKNDLPPEIEPAPYKSNLMDVKKWSPAAVVTQLDGSSWTTDFFRTVSGASQAAAEPDWSSPDVQQQYEHIVNMELLVTQELTASQDPTSGEFVIRGSANVYGVGMVPSKGNAFVAQAADGGLAVFVLEEVRRLSVYTGAAFEISYKEVRRYGTFEQQWFQARTVSRVYFEKNYLQRGKNPFVMEERYKLILELRKKREELTERMYLKFYHPRLQNLMVPKQDGYTYDSFLSIAWQDITGISGNPKWSGYRFVNVTPMRAFNALSIWDSLVNGRSWNPDLVVRHVGLMPTRSMVGDFYTMGPKFFGYQNIVEPIGMTYPTGYIEYGDSANHIIPMVDGVDECEGYCPPKPPTEIPPFDPTLPPLIHPVLGDAFYVFTRGFYEGEGERMSVLEREVNNYLTGRHCDIDAVCALVRDVANWGELEQFYYLPALLCLINYIDWGPR